MYNIYSAQNADLNLVRHVFTLGDSFKLLAVGLYIQMGHFFNNYQNNILSFYKKCHLYTFTY